MMRTSMLRLALLGTIASLPALAQSPSTGPERAREPVATHGNAGSNGSTLSPPSAGAARGNETRADSVRPATPNQGAAAGQGIAQGPVTGRTNDNAATTGQGSGPAPATGGGNA